MKQICGLHQANIVHVETGFRRMARCNLRSTYVSSIIRSPSPRDFSSLSKLRRSSFVYYIQYAAHIFLDILKKHVSRYASSGHDDDKFAGHVSIEIQEISVGKEQVRV